MIKAAFFDVDNTLINIKSMFNFFDFWTKNTQQLEIKKRFDDAFEEAWKSQKKREELNSLYYTFFKGTAIEELYSEGIDWFNHVLKHNIFINNIVQQLQEHKKNGTHIVFVSGSMKPLLEPIANYLGVTHILCTELITDSQNRLTGQIGTLQTIGAGKAEAIKQFANENHVNLTDSYAYGDDISDIPMLESVGNPVCVGEDKKLTSYAQQHNWQILSY